MKQYISILISFALILGIIFAVRQAPKDISQITLDDSVTSTSISTVVSKNTTIIDDVQYITITAKGGYFPRTSFAKAGIPTVIIMNTNNTYDCSSFLVIDALNYQDALPPSGKTEIDAGTFASGEKLRGLCSMGMYNFDIQFIK